MEYIILKGDNSISELRKKVNEKIKEGYKPIGGIAVAVDPDFNHEYCQAMIK